VAGFAVVLFLK